MRTDQVVTAEGASVHVAESVQARAPAPGARLLRVLLWLVGRTPAVAVVLFTIVLLFQWLGGAFTSEFSGYPDEASHYISGLLVHDYIAAGCPAKPMQFARQFYLHYPYLGIGHWPPLFYAFEGVWMLLFSPSRISVMVLMALITAVLGISTYCGLRRDIGGAAALLTAVLLLSSPLVQKYSAMVMLDIPVAVLSFLAVLCLGRFFDSGRWQDSIAFGVLASLAILTKGDAFRLALVPPIALLLTRRFYLVRRIAFWLPAVLVALLALPWYLFTMHLVVPTWVNSAGIEFTWQAARFYAALLEKSVGPAVVGIMLVGSVACIATALKDQGATAKWIVLTSYVVSGFIFNCMVPAGIEARFFLSLLPPLFMLFGFGTAYCAKLPIVATIRWRWRSISTVLIAGLVFSATAYSLPHKESRGLSDAVDALMSMPQFRNSLSLVSSETTSGEGIYVSEVAMRGQRTEHAILRASKVLADSDWIMKYYRPRYASTETLMECLGRTPIRFIVMDMSPAPRHLEHHRQLMQLLRNRSDRWKLVGVFNGGHAGHSPIYVYRSLEITNTATMPQVPLGNIVTNIDDSLGHWPISERLACEPGSSSMKLRNLSTSE